MNKDAYLFIAMQNNYDKESYSSVACEYIEDQFYCLKTSDRHVYSTNPSETRRNVSQFDYNKEKSFCVRTDMDWHI